jgi:hypothetical protein
MATSVGSAFSYQGNLNFNSSPANGNYDFQFLLFTAATGGTAVDTITLADQKVTSGLINESLDFTDVPFNGQALWIEVHVRPAGGSSYTTLSPRQALTATPYALFALSGNEGPQGAAGPKGATGATGPAGATGTMGLPGPSGSIALPYSATASSANPIFQVRNAGSGFAIQGESSGTGFNGAALVGSNTTDGGLALYAYGNSPSGTAAIITNDSTSGGDILQGWNQGGVRFHFDTAGDLSTQGGLTANAVTVSTASSGPAISSSAALFGVSGTATGNSGAGVIGVGKGTSIGVAGNSVSADGVKGLSTNGNGVEGDSAGNGTTGVYGQSSNAGGYGVYGRNTAGGYGMATDGPAFQARTEGGWVKAMAFVSQTAGKIVRCYNSQIAAPQSSTPPCGMTFTNPQSGEMTLDFGFEVDDRFISLTASAQGGSASLASCSGGTTNDFCSPGFPTPTSIGIETLARDGSPASVFNVMIFVY